MWKLSNSRGGGFYRDWIRFLWVVGDIPTWQFEIYRSNCERMLSRKEVDLCVN